MRHRHLTHEAFTLAAIEDILARGSVPDWAPLARAIEADPHGEVAEKTLRICTAREIYGASKLFSRLIRKARQQIDDPMPSNGAEAIRDVLKPAVDPSLSVDLAKTYTDEFLEAKP